MTVQLFHLKINPFDFNFGDDDKASGLILTEKRDEFLGNRLLLWQNFEQEIKPEY